jgi:hypothetical protein
MMVKLAELWRFLPENQKQAYHEEAEREKGRYIEDLELFHTNNPNEVIQNKTKKNHVKKPCSAYALYLKENKKSIKLEHPDLKMADILKVVGQRWKELPENLKSHFQRMALAEKEIAKAKMNENLFQNEEPAPQKKKSSPKKEQKSKTSPKSLKESIKTEEGTPEHSSKYHTAPIEFQLEEPELQKHRTLNVNVQAPSQYLQVPFYSSIMNSEIDATLSEIKEIPNSVNSGIQRNMSIEMAFTRDLSSFWKSYELPQLNSFLSNDTIDLMNFGSMGAEPAKLCSDHQDQIKDESEEFTTEATYMSPRSITGKTMNETVMSLLDSENSFEPNNEDGIDNMWKSYIKI